MGTPRKPRFHSAGRYTRLALGDSNFADRVRYQPLLYGRMLSSILRFVMSQEKESLLGSKSDDLQPL